MLILIQAFNLPLKTSTLSTFLISLGIEFQIETALTGNDIFAGLVDVRGMTRFRLDLLLVFALQILILSLINLGVSFFRTFHVCTAEWKNISCLMLIQPHCWSKILVGVYHDFLVTYLAALFWITCTALIKNFSEPPHTMIMYCTIDIKYEFARRSRDLKLALTVACFRTPNLRAKDVVIEFLHPIICCFHPKDWFTFIPSSFSVSEGLTSTDPVSSTTLFLNRLCFLVPMTKRCVFSSFITNCYHGKNWRGAYTSKLDFYLAVEDPCLNK